MSPETPAKTFLPVSREDMAQRGWGQADVVLVTGDAYVDHPAFGTAVIGRLLEKQGRKVGIVSAPNWREPESVSGLGEPKLFFGISSGNVDSMLAHYTAFKKPRRDDPYAAGGRPNTKPERAVIVYSNLVRQQFKETPIVIGGIEASLRRLAHYDYWENRVRRSILADTRADILVYGMGEKPIKEIIRRMFLGKRLNGVPGTALFADVAPIDAAMLPCEEDALSDKTAFNEMYRLFYRYQAYRVLAQPTGKRFLVHYPPPTVAAEELDAVYRLPFTRQAHPMHKEPVPALGMIRNSVASHRGCVSGCSFCSLSIHQGKRIVRRSKSSILDEVQAIAAQPGFKGHITDIGGPTANMYGFSCMGPHDCPRESCASPSLCRHLRIQNQPWLDLLAEASSIKGVKHVTVGSGIRYDLFMQDRQAEAQLKQLAESHVSGQLKIAPEHTDLTVLKAMRKKPLYPLRNFADRFAAASRRVGKEQYLLPYLMSCHPGCNRKEMHELKRDVLSLLRFIPRQVQAFIPLPMTLSSVIYHTGKDPVSGERFFVEQGPAQRRQQHEVLRASPPPSKRGEWPRENNRRRKPPGKGERRTQRRRL